MQFATNKEGTTFPRKFSLKKEREQLWNARKTALWAARTFVSISLLILSLASLKPGAEVKITDVCVPISRLAECIEETKNDLKNSSIPAPLVGHVGDGSCFLVVLEMT